MPKRTDIKKILVIGSGPIVIGQACEFDYSGTQAIRALKEEGYDVILVNSNPATIMTDPDFSSAVYIEPLNLKYLTKIIEREKPHALLPTMGGQTALNLTMELHYAGVLAEHEVILLGATPEAIHRAEDRATFKKIMESIGVESAKSRVAHSLEEGKKIMKEFGLPLILRPSFTLGGEGGGAAHTEDEFLQKLERALFLSPTHDCLVEESLLNWKEYELEVVRDKNDNVIIVCSIENLDPMGVHTGDSITIAPAQTLTDKEYQSLREQSKKIIRAIGVETGGSNIQFAVHPETGRSIVIEMNPRVSRSSALASKATGFPIARVAAKLAVGYTLDEIQNDITGTTPASFEPSIDYVVTKIPRFDFEKFRPTETLLSTQMKSVGEVMAIGRTFEESLGKALSGIETDRPWFNSLGEDREHYLSFPNPLRLNAVADSMRHGVSLDLLHEKTGIDPWFLNKIHHHISFETVLQGEGKKFSHSTLLQAKRLGWSDKAIAAVSGKSETEIQIDREKYGIHAHFSSVDTCAAEFEAKTPYLYSSYWSTEEPRVSNRKKVMILGGGPNRIGQGIEFDYCCVHASIALREAGYETIMVNSNPETVSTDFDLSDKLYFEPLTPEHVLNIARVEKPLGVIVQLGGQTPLKLAKALEAGGLPILGTTTESIDTAEDRERCGKLLEKLESLGLKQPPSATAIEREDALKKGEALGFPLLVRPSYVLGGKGMRVVHNFAHLEQYIDEAIRLSDKHPVLLDRFLDRATEVDVDCISDGTDTLVCGVLEHIEEAGIHSGDSSCSLPVFTLPTAIVDRIRTYSRKISKELNVKGFINIQYAIQGTEIFVLEINPRASRTIPFISKSVGFPLAKIASRVMVGETLAEMGFSEDFDFGLTNMHVKAPVFPFHKFPKVDPILGPEMKSTGEVMGRAPRFDQAFAKAMSAAGMQLPTEGEVFLSIRNEDKAEVLPIAENLHEMGFRLSATKGTADFLNSFGLNVRVTRKIYEGHPNCVDEMRDGRYQLVINTTSDEKAIRDSYLMRRATLERKVPFATVLSSARAMIQAIQAEQRGDIEVLPITERW